MSPLLDFRELLRIRGFEEMSSVLFKKNTVALFYVILMTSPALNFVCLFYIFSGEIKSKFECENMMGVNRSSREE